MKASGGHFFQLQLERRRSSNHRARHLKQNLRRLADEMPAQRSIILATGDKRVHCVPKCLAARRRLDHPGDKVGAQEPASVKLLEEFRRVDEVSYKILPT